MTGKWCNCCGKDRPLESFWARKGVKDGLQPHCKECQREKQRVRTQSPKWRENLRRWQEKNPERMREYKRKWAAKSYAADPKKWNDACVQRERQAREELAPSYVKRLAAQGSQCPRSQVPDALVEAITQHVRLRRLIKEQSK